MPRMQLVSRKTIYQGHVIRLVREVLKSNGRTFARETIQHPGAVVILPVLDDARIVFVRQYRRAIGRFILELPAGTLMPGEPKQRCAQRELEEETGWRATQWQRLGQFYAAPGFLSEQMTLFLAHGLTKTVARPEPDEWLTPVILSLNSAVAKIRSGAICDAKSIIGVLVLREWLRARGLKRSGNWCRLIP